MTGQVADFESSGNCIHCGLCVASCPTFLELGTEMDSPRGRIQLMHSIDQGTIPLDDASVRHLDLCLGCRACETTCPSGVRYGTLIEGARHFIETRYRRPWPERAKRWLVNRTFPNPAIMRLFGRAARCLTWLGLGALAHSRLLPKSVRGLLRYLPDRDAGFRSVRLPERTAAQGEARHRVGLLAGCVMQSLFGDTHTNTVQLLARHGCEVRVPPAAGCCGALPLHNGDRARGLEMARAAISAFDSPELDVVLTNAAGCGAAMREYGEHFKDDPALGPAAKRVADKVRDVAEFVHGLPGLDPKRSLDVRVAYHDACHLLNGQGVQAQPRRLLSGIPGVELVELHEAEVCCGSAGSYNLTEPELAGRLAARKARNVVATGADVLVTGNPGCILQIRAALREQGSSIRVVHTVDFLAEAYTNRAAARG